MTTRDFARWFAVFRAQFPSHERLKSAGVFWYPGEAGGGQERDRREARRIGKVHGYHLSLSNVSPDDERIRVCVQGEGEAHFWCGSHIELDRCYLGFDEAEIETIREILAAATSDKRGALEASRARERLTLEWRAPSGGDLKSLMIRRAFLVAIGTFVISAVAIHLWNRHCCQAVRITRR